MGLLPVILYKHNMIINSQVWVFDYPSQREGQSQKIGNIDGDFDILARQHVCLWFFKTCDVSC
jgi:hypothetical protein